MHTCIHSCAPVTHHYTWVTYPFSLCHFFCFLLLVLLENKNSIKIYSVAAVCFKQYFGVKVSQMKLELSRALLVVFLSPSLPFPSLCPSSQMVMAHQDEQLDKVGASVVTLKRMGETIGDELDDQQM